MRFNILFRTLSIPAVLLCSLPAWATWDGEVSVTGTSATALKESTLSFETGGQTLPVTVEGTDEDGNAILVIGFTGDNATAGTLTIAGPDGTQKIATPAAGAGENILINTSGPGSASVQKPAPPSMSSSGPRNRLTLGGGIMNVEGDNPATAGVVVPSGSSEFLPLSANFDVDLTGFSVGYGFESNINVAKWLNPKGGSAKLSFDFSYADLSGDETGVSSTQSGGDDTGFLYTRDLNGFTGIGAGPSGLESQSMIDVDYDRLAVSMGFPVECNFGDNVTVSPIISLGYSGFDYTIQSMDTFDPNLLDPDQFFDHRFQQVDQDIYDLGLGVRVQRFLGDSGNFDVFSDVTAKLYRNEAELQSQEEIVISGSPEMVDYFDKESDTSVGAELGVGAGYNFSDHWRLEGSVNYEWNVPTASVVNPTGGDFDRTPLFLDLNGENRWRAGVQVGYSF